MLSPVKETGTLLGAVMLYTTKSAKEIAYLLGYEDTAAFSRFFAKMNGESITGFRQREKRE